MEDLKISRKLIAEVLMINSIFKIHIKDNNLIVRCRYKCAGQITNGTKIINLDTFVRLCKELVLGKGYLIDERGVNLYILTDDGISDMYKSYGKPFCPFRVFEACEWILSQKDKK